MFKIIILVTVLKITFAARILGVAPIPSYSHQIVYRAIWKELSLQGHDLVVLTTDPINDPSLKNYKEIDLSFTYDIWNVKYNVPKMGAETKNILQLVNLFTNALNDIAAQELGHPEVQALINNKTEHFDLVMIEYMQPTFFPFKHRFNASFIGLSSLDAHYNAHKIVGNPVHPIMYPDFSMPFVGKLTFVQRIITTYFNTFTLWWSEKTVLPLENLSVEKYFGTGYPDLITLSEQVDMLFINVNPIMHIIRPLTPATITIGGGIHINKAKPLPQDLKKMLDDANEGVIYMSLGSNIKSKELSTQVRINILKVFGELPYKVLWKFEAENLPGKPSNVEIMKWIPQQDVLRHPNIKLFITQGGLQSLDETLYSHVPIVGMPFFADQDTNIQKVVSKGFGLSVNYKDMTADELKATILEVINNPKYRNTIIELAELTRDEPMTGLEKAVWWTEYVLRHKGAQHLKGPGIDLPLYQYYHLDVLAFTLLVLVILGTVTYIVVKKTIQILLKYIFKKKVKTQ